MLKIFIAQTSLASAVLGLVCELHNKIQPLSEISYSIKDQSLQNNNEPEDDEGQKLCGINVTRCVPNPSGQASCPLIITIRCTDLYQQLINIKGSILFLCAVGEPSLTLPMAFTSSQELPWHEGKSGKATVEQALGP